MVARQPRLSHSDPNGRAFAEIRNQGFPYNLFAGLQSPPWTVLPIRWHRMSAATPMSDPQGRASESSGRVLDENV